MTCLKIGKLLTNCSFKCTQNIDKQRFGNREDIKCALAWLARIVTKQYWH